MTQSHATAIESWPITGGFTIARETKTGAVVVTVTLMRNGMTGSGECVPLKRYGHTAESVRATIDAWLHTHDVWTRENLLNTMDAGPARFALDTAMWMLEAAEHNISFWDHADLGKNVARLPTAFTLSGAAPEMMAQRAPHYTAHRWLKIKLMGDGADRARLEQIHAAVPQMDLIVDANESLSVDGLQELLPVMKDCRVVAIEQPLPEGRDDALRGLNTDIPLVADESCHTADNLVDLQGKYAIINIKLDKTGGLTHALSMSAQARTMGFDIMVGCMASTGLSLAPALVVAQHATLMDLDGALLLEKDRSESMIFYDSGHICVL